LASPYGGEGLGRPTWPIEVSGAGLDAAHAAIIRSELERADAFNPIGGLGVRMLGPTLLEFGTPEQIAQHLPLISRAELR
jgi:alkylation response protein AidB-like acyl-CoA dehydrogenase